MVSGKHSLDGSHIYVNNQKPQNLDLKNMHRIYSLKKNIFFSLFEFSMYFSTGRLAEVKLKKEDGKLPASHTLQVQLM